MRCSACGKEMPAQDLAFCPYCGMKLENPAQAGEITDSAADKMDDATRRQMMSDIIKAKQQVDLRKRKDILLKLREKYPECFEVEQELLFIGHPRKNRKDSIDYFIIKCYLLDIYLHPRNFTDEVRDSCRDEIFGDGQLQKCCALSGKGEGFIEEYTRRLCTEYVTLFLQGSSEYGRSFFGLFRDRHPEQTLAAPVCTMLFNIREDTRLEYERRMLLMRCMYGAFSKAVDGKTLYIDAAMGEKGISV